jgi:type II secretory pathway pseudopilin PulG
MGLRGQALCGERGYAMAALLVALAIMSILLTVAMPVWRVESRREKEAELVFRGEQYARAIALFRFKNPNIPNALPPSIDMLVQGRFLRKKYKDPMVANGEFQIIGGAQGAPGAQQPPAQAGARGGTSNPQLGSPNAPTMGGIMGVRSKSTENSLRTYRGATRYDQWNFTFAIVPRPGGSMPMAQPGQGVPGGAPGGPGAPGGRGPGGGRGPRGEGGGPGRGMERGPGRGGFPPPPPPVPGRGRGPTGRGGLP